MAVYMSCCGIPLTITLHQISPFLFFCTELCDQVGGPTPQQAAGYEEFARCLPGFLPSSSAAAGAKVRHLWNPTQEDFLIIGGRVWPHSQATENNPHGLGTRLLEGHTLLRGWLWRVKLLCQDSGTRSHVSQELEATCLINSEGNTIFWHHMQIEDIQLCTGNKLGICTT